MGFFNVQTAGSLTAELSLGLSFIHFVLSDFCVISIVCCISLLSLRSQLILMRDKMGVDPNRRGCTERSGGNEIDNQDIPNEKKNIVNENHKNKCKSI